MGYKSIESGDALREDLSVKIIAVAKNDEPKTRLSVIQVLRCCMIDGLMFYVPIVKRPIMESYNGLCKFVDMETASDRSFILRPVCDPQIDCFMAFVYEDDLRRLLPDAPYLCSTLTDLCQELIQIDTIDGLRIITGDEIFVVDTDQLISLSIMAHVPSRGHVE